jgi:hypothetical protein
MSGELIAILITAGFQAALLAAALVMLVQVAGITHEVRDNQIADDGAIFLQGRRIEEIIREMRESLRGLGRGFHDGEPEPARG